MLFLLQDTQDGHGTALDAVVPADSPSRGGDVTVYVWRKPTELAHSFFYSLLVSVSVFMALSTVFHSMNSSDNSPYSHSVLLSVLSMPYWSFQLYMSLYESLLQP